MKGYKGFEKGLICRGKQYAENTVFEEDNAKICKSGMHFCKNPFDVLGYYGFVGDNGELNEFCEVEALDDAKTDDDSKFCTKKLKIGANIGISGLIKAFIGFVLEKTTESNSGFQSVSINSGDQSVSSNSGDQSLSSNSGFQSLSINSGNQSVSSNSGFQSLSSNSGFRSLSINSGDRSVSSNSGFQSVSINSGDQSLSINSGDQSVSSNSGFQSLSSNSGFRSLSINSGNRSLSSNSGFRSLSINSGDRSCATVSGLESLAIATGIESKAKGTLGCYIALAEWEWSDDEENYKLVSFKSHKVDGKTIKPDVFYMLKGGKFVKADAEDKP